jgi:fructokinase
VIAVVGEALIDLVIDPAGAVTAALGGAPFNTARACGRLGVETSFLGTLSRDRFGTMLFERLRSDGVDVSSAPRVDRPTTLAAAELDGRGAASYRFYIDGTSAPALDRPPDLGAVDVLFTGGLGLVLEPMAATVAATVAGVDAATLVVVDVNCRPLVVPDPDAYRRRVERVIARAHLVKVSDEDLDYLAPGVDHAEAALAIVHRGSEAVLVTGGGEGVRIVTARGDRFVPVEPVEVVDTIGAGDTFGGALIAWLVLNGVRSEALDDLDLLERAVRAANAAAGVVCTRRGADPPYRAELPSSWSS